MLYINAVVKIDNYSKMIKAMKKFSFFNLTERFCLKKESSEHATVIFETATYSL